MTKERRVVSFATAIPDEKHRLRLIKLIAENYSYEEIAQKMENVPRLNTKGKVAGVIFRSKEEIERNVGILLIQFEIKSKGNSRPSKGRQKQAKPAVLPSAPTPQPPPLQPEPEPEPEPAPIVQEAEPIPELEPEPEEIPELAPDLVVVMEVPKLESRAAPPTPLSKQKVVLSNAEFIGMIAEAIEKWAKKPELRQEFSVYKYAADEIGRKTGEYVRFDSVTKQITCYGGLKTFLMQVGGLSAQQADAIAEKVDSGE